MQNFMEKPETKAQLEKMKAQNDKLQNQLVASVYRVLTKRQGAAYKKMLGAPFDASKLTGGPGQGGRNGGTAQATASADEEEKLQAKPAAPAPKAKSSAAAKSTAKRKSLRELRGLDDQ
jgi:hypothetical protein